MLSVNGNDAWAIFSVGAAFPVMELSEKMEWERWAGGIVIGVELLIF